MSLNKLVIGLLKTNTAPLLFPAERLVEQGVEVRELEIGDAAPNWSGYADVRMVIIEQSRRRPYSNFTLQKLRRRFPLALFVCVNGRWSEGAQRSGRPYAGVIHVRACEAVYRIQRLIGGFRAKANVMGEYRPLFSSRESLDWWLRIGVTNAVNRSSSDVYVYGHRDATGGIFRAFSNAGWNVEQRSFRTIMDLKPEDVEKIHKGRAILGVVRGRGQVRQLVQANLLQEFDALVADNITRQEQKKLDKRFQCQVIAKPFQNDDLIEALGNLRRRVVAKAG